MNKTRIPEIPDGYGYGDRFCKPDGYGYEYGDDSKMGMDAGISLPAPRPSLTILGLSNKGHTSALFFFKLK